MSSHRRRDLVFLVYSENTCYTRVVRGVPKGVLVFPSKGTWVYRGPSDSGYIRTTEHEIGTSRYSSGHSFPGLVIGVYDRTMISHLNHLVSDAKEATADRFAQSMAD